MKWLIVAIVLLIVFIVAMRLSEWTYRERHFFNHRSRTYNRDLRQIERDAKEASAYRKKIIKQYEALNKKKKTNTK